MTNKVWKIFKGLTKGLSEEKKRIINAETSIRDNIALALMKIREKSGLSQREVAKKLGTSKSWVSRLENANYDHRIESIWAYLTALNAEVYLLVKMPTGEKIFVNENSIKYERRKYGQEERKKRDGKN